MTLEFKFEKGTTVFFLKENKVHSGIIGAVKGGDGIIEKKDSSLINKYRKYHIKNEDWYFEDNLFSSKEELLKSL